MPFVLLAILVGMTVLVRLTLLKPAAPPTAAGAAVMGTGIFALGALQRIPSGPGLPTQIVALEVLIIWIYIAWSFVRSYFEGSFGKHVNDTIGCFAIGTWIAGTSVMASLVYVAFPDWQLLAILFGIIAALVFLPYLALVLIRFEQIIANPTQLPVTGRVLLPTVSMQSLVVATFVLVPGLMPGWLALGLIASGFALYLLGLVLIILRYAGTRGWGLSTDWDNTNCILHGAMSITGLASVLSGAVPEPLVVATWVWVAGMFVLVEGIEIARMWVRIRAFGLRRGILAYNVSQWARNFTFGMFYLFTFRAYVERKAHGEADIPLITGVQAVIISWGQYVVLFFLLAEVVLFLWDNVSQKQVAQEASGERQPSLSPRS